MKIHTALTSAALGIVLASCGNAADDGGGDATCTDPAWKPATSTLDRAVLSAWGTSADDVYLVGGDLGVGGKGPLLAHWDGHTFTEQKTFQDRTLWWMWGTPDAKVLWFVGEGGTVLRHLGGSLDPLFTPTKATLFGVWGSAANDVWIVGGEPGPDGVDKDMVLHYDGVKIKRDPLPTARGTALLKIWGSGPGDIWVVGEGGTLWHRDGAGWTDRSAEVATPYTLNSVHGCGPSEVYAVGGKTIFRFDGTSWSHVAEAEGMISGSVVGVSCGAMAVAVVGAGGLKLRLDKATGQWHDETISEPWNTDFHGAWVAPDGDIWAVGGNYATPASSTDTRLGVVGYRGCEQPVWSN